MDGVFPPKPGEVVLPPVLTEQMRVERVDLIERQLGSRWHITTEDGLLLLGVPNRSGGQPRRPIGLGLTHSMSPEMGA